MSRPQKWRPRWPRSQEKAGGSERLHLIKHTGNPGVHLNSPFNFHSRDEPMKYTRDNNMKL